jgi:hypothetical protein
LGWELDWQDGPSRQQASQALAELASPAFPAFTKVLAERKLRTHRAVSQRAWALHLVGVAAAGGVAPDLDDTTVYWDTLEHLQDEVAFPERPPTPAAGAAAQELLSLAQALQPVVGQGPARPRRGAGPGAAAAPLGGRRDRERHGEASVARPCRRHRPDQSRRRQRPQAGRRGAAPGPAAVRDGHAAAPWLPATGPPLRALSVWQPWAWALVQGLKDVENRTRRTNWRGWLWIHAGLRLDEDALAWLDALGVAVPAAVLLPRGCLVGAVEVTDCVQDSPSRWAVPGQWHWQIGQSWALDEPIPATGRLGLFTVEQVLATAAAARPCAVTAG